MSSVHQSQYYSTASKESFTKPEYYSQYVTDSTPKRLPSLEQEQNTVNYTPVPSSNYIYVNTTSSTTPINSDIDSPVKRPHSALSTGSPQTPVKLPSFKSLMASINDNTHTTLSFDTPLMNSLNLENSHFRAMPKSVSSSESSVDGSPLANDQQSTFLGIYSYSKTQFSDPYVPEKRLAAAPQIISARSQQSPLQYQQERFPTNSYIPQIPQFNFQYPQSDKPLDGLQKLAHVAKNNNYLKVAPTISTPPQISNHESNEKKFKCKICSRGFNTAGNLSRHKKVHTGEKRYKCQFSGCESKFARSDSCMQHYRTHANENGYTSRRFKKMKTDGPDCENQLDENQVVIA